MGQGAPLGEEAVLAESGRAGKKVAFLSILRKKGGTGETGNGSMFEVRGFRNFEPRTSNRAFPKQGRSSEADPRFTFHASRFTVRLAAFRTRCRFFCCLTLFGGQGEKLFALAAGANFEVGGSLVVDVGGQEQLQRVISDHDAVGKFNDGQAVVKDLKGSFLPFSGQYMPEDEHRLSLSFRAEVS